MFNLSQAEYFTARIATIHHGSEEYNSYGERMNVDNSRSSFSPVEENDVAQFTKELESEFSRFVKSNFRPG